MPTLLTEISLCSLFNQLSLCQSQILVNRNDTSSIKIITNMQSDITKEFKTITGSLSGKIVNLPNVNKAPMPAVDASGFVLNGEPCTGIEITNFPGLPDSKSYNKKFALLIPFTNTVMEHELWSIILNNQNEGGLNGVGLHTVNVEIPKPHVNNETELLQFK